MLSSAQPFADSLKVLFKETAQQLKGSARRQFMAKVVQEYGVGGQMWAEAELGWNRGTIRKGQSELVDGAIRDKFEQRGRKRVEEHLPKLREDIRAIVDPQVQADPTLRSARVYSRMSVAEVRRQLICKKGYSDEELPCDEVLRRRLNEMGYGLKRVQKTKPQKVIAETEDIFKQVNQVNQAADEDQASLRISIDTKTAVKVGEYDRGGKNTDDDPCQRP